MPEYKYAAYPSAKIYNDEKRQIQHLLWGDWVRIEGDEEAGWVPVYARKTTGWMKVEDLQDDRLLELVFVDVGQGDGCLMVTPDDKKYVIDAGEGDNMYRYLKWRFNFRGGLRTFDGAIMTHPDQDHYYGFHHIFNDANVKFKKIYHNGIMERKDIAPFGKKVTQGGKNWVCDLIKTKAEMEAFLSVPSRYGTKRYANVMKDGLSALTASGNVEMVHASTDSNVTRYLDGFEEDKDVSIKVLGPVPELDSNGNMRLRWFNGKPGGRGTNPGKTKNGHSIILMLEYGDLKISLGGDLNSSAEAYLIEHYTGLEWPPENDEAAITLAGATREVFGADISKCCHHGSADFLDVFLKSVNPAATVVSSGDQESHAHPRCDTLGAIGRHGRGWRPLILSTELSRSSREDENSLAYEVGRLKGKIEKEDDPAEKELLTIAREKLIDELKKRNVTTYGAINVRTDGRKVVLAIMLEEERVIGKSLTKWDIYRMEKVGGGPFVYVE